jgi:hypothetical protein
MGDASVCQHLIEIRQEDVDQLIASAQPQMQRQISIDQLPPQMLAGLPPQIQALVRQGQWVPPRQSQ